MFFVSVEEVRENKEEKRKINTNPVFIYEGGVIKTDNFLPPLNILEYIHFRSFVCTEVVYKLMVYGSFKHKIMFIGTTVFEI